MANEVNNETEESKTGETSVVEQTSKQDAAEASTTPAPEVAVETASAPAPEAAAETLPAPAPEVAPIPAATAPDAPRTVARPASMAPPEAPAPKAPSAKASSDAAEEPQSMGDIDFGAILEQFEQEQTVYHAGELVEGKVVGVSDRGILVDFGYKSEGVIPAEEAAAAVEPPNVGDTIEVVIKSITSGDAPPVLSRVDAKMRKVWNDIEESFKQEQTVTGHIVDKTKGGLRVDLNGIEAFLPGSQIDSRPIRSLDSYIGQDIEAKIIKFRPPPQQHRFVAKGNYGSRHQRAKSGDHEPDRRRLCCRRYDQESHRIRCIR